MGVRKRPQALVFPAPATLRETITIQRDVADEAALAVRQALGAEKRVQHGRPVRPWGVSVAAAERELELLDRGSL